MVGPIPRIYTLAASISRIVLGAAMCVLVTIEFARQSFQFYRATKVWQPNRYMKLLLKQGLLYFFVYVPVSSLLTSPGIQARK